MKNIIFSLITHLLIQTEFEGKQYGKTYNQGCLYQVVRG